MAFSIFHSAYIFLVKQEWENEKADLGVKYKYVQRQSEFDDIDVNNVDYVLGKAGNLAQPKGIFCDSSHTEILDLIHRALQS